MDSTVIANNLSLSTPKPGGAKDSRIKVAVRSRPFLPRELAKVPPEENVLDVTEDQVIVALKKPFRFDQIFGAESTQDQLYQAVVQSNVHQVNIKYLHTINRGRCIIIITKTFPWL